MMEGTYVGRAIIVRVWLDKFGVQLGSSATNQECHYIWTADFWLSKSCQDDMARLPKTFCRGWRANTQGAGHGQ